MKHENEHPPLDAQGRLPESAADEANENPVPKLPLWVYLLFVAGIMLVLLLVEGVLEWLF